METQPKWLCRLLEVFMESVEWTSVKSPTHQVFTYRCQYNHSEQVWELIISPWLHEIYGGKNDGAIRLPTYEMNVLAVADEFDSVKHIGFDTARLESSIEGKIDDTWVHLIFSRKAPENSNVRKKINIYTGEVTKIVANKED
jgi:hypothetical protein